MDAPGYGYSSVSENRENTYKRLVKYYLLNSSRLCHVYWVTSLTSPLNKNDQLFFNFIKYCMVPVTLVFTKADKMEPEKAMDTLIAHSHVFRQFDVVSPLSIITSSKQKFGIQELKNHINFRYNF